MKSLITTTLIFLSVLSTSLGQSFEKASYQKKIKHYSVMQTGGIVMGVTGVASTISGAALIVSMNDEAGEDNVAKAVGGVLLVIVGVPLIAGGTTLGIIGSVKKAKYKAKLENLSFDLRYDHRQKGLAVTYKF